jgi:hypothetical protein
VRPDTILRWHRELLRRHHARMSRPKRPGRPRTIRSIRVLVLRLAMHGDDASSSAAVEPSAWQHRPAHRPHRAEPDIAVGIEVIDGEGATRLARQQRKAIVDVLT